MDKHILMQCARRRCGHVIFDNERIWIGEKNFRRATCPACEGDSFYTLHADGAKATMADRDKDMEINPLDIEPSLKIGRKTRVLMKAAKQRFTAA